MIDWENTNLLEIIYDMDWLLCVRCDIVDLLLQRYFSVDIVVTNTSVQIGQTRDI